MMDRYPSAAQMLQIVASNKFRPFDQHDWEAFAGCESKNPLICYWDALTIVIDGDKINVIHPHDEYGGELYNLNCLHNAE